MKCKATTAKGEPCRREAVHGDYCALHKDQAPYEAEIMDQHEIGKKDDDPAVAFLEYLKANAPEQVVGAFEALLKQNNDLKAKLEQAAKDYQAAIEQGRSAQSGASAEEVVQARKAAAENLKKARVGVDTAREKARQDKEPKVRVTRFEKDFTVLKNGERKWASVVQLNGVNYVFISGEAVEVPASVAAMLEDRDQDRANLEEKLQRVQGIQEYEVLRAALEN